MAANKSSIKQEFEEKRISVSNLICTIISWIMTVVWMIEISRLSAETGEQSSSRSQQLLLFIETKLGITFISESLLRDMAHVTEYLILTILCYIAIYFSNKIIKRDINADNILDIYKSDVEICTLSTLWITALFAILDEYHQLFVTERSGSIIDVCIDSIGIVIVLVFIKLVSTIKIYKLRRM